MTNEQRVRVDRLVRYLITDREKTYTTVRVNDLDTVLSLIKEQEKYIKDANDITEEMNGDIMRLIYELKQKDKQIDLMAELVYKRYKAELLLEYGFENEEQLKQYFADLVEKE